jgi:hypothetical protein
VHGASGIAQRLHASVVHIVHNCALEAGASSYDSPWGCRPWQHLHGVDGSKTFRSALHSWGPVDWIPMPSVHLHVSAI